MPGRLADFSVSNLHRRIKTILDKVEVGAAVGGVDVSFNEDSDERYAPFWSVHVYLIASTRDQQKLGKRLRRAFERSIATPRPTKVVSFKNVARRRSYALKMHFKRRAGRDKSQNRGGKTWMVRNTQSQRMRSAERFELFLFLDHAGLAQRVIFRGCEPRLAKNRVSIERR
jgi:hypothetical protein